MPVLVDLCRDGADMVLLVKPQFEAGRAEAARGRGVVRDPEIWGRVLHEVARSAEAEGAPVQGVAPSPIRGAEGNVEFLLHIRRGAAVVEVDLDAAVADVPPR